MVIKHFKKNGHDFYIAGRTQEDVNAEADEVFNLAAECFVANITVARARELGLGLLDKAIEAYSKPDPTTRGFMLVTPVLATAK